MAQMIVRAQLQHRHGAGQSRGLALGGGYATDRRVVRVRCGSVASQYISQLPIRDMFTECIRHVKVEWEADAGAQSGTVMESWWGADGWQVADPVVPAVGFLNQTRPAIDIQPVNGTYQYVLNFETAAAALLDDLIDGFLTVVLDIGPINPTVNPAPNMQSVPAEAGTSKELWWYIDDSLGESFMDPAPALARLLSEMRGRGDGGYTLAVNAVQPSQSISVAGCNTALPYGNPFVLSGDIGQGFGQIPLDPDGTPPLQWSQLANHPRCFIRRPDRVLSLLTVGDIERYAEPVELPEAYDGTPWIVTRAPQYSLWRFVVDGAPMDCLISHGSKDLRRPRDIWNSIIVPAMNSGAPLPLYDMGMIFPDTNTIPTRLFMPRGTFQAWQYLDYAWCCGLWDDDVTQPIYSPGVVPVEPPA